MTDPLGKADQYRQEAAKCYELAKSASGLSRRRLWARTKHARGLVGSGCARKKPGVLTTNPTRPSKGIAKAKAAGVYKGRPASIDATQVCKSQGLGGRQRSRRR
jgi:hypothetical protein